MELKAYTIGRWDTSGGMERYAAEYGRVQPFSDKEGRDILQTRSRLENVKNGKSTYAVWGRSFPRGSLQTVLESSFTSTALASRAHRRTAIGPVQFYETKTSGKC